MLILYEMCDCFTAYAPFLRLSPPPGDQDYYFNLDDSEGVCDLFDVPLLKWWKPNLLALQWFLLAEMWM